MKDANESITLREGYEMMLHLLNNYLELTGSEDLTDILSGGEYLADGQPTDSAFWDYWLEAHETLCKEGPLYKSFS